MGTKNIISQSKIASKIYIIRNQRVMLDKDLAILYDVETKNLKRAVKRHIHRFPIDFMFELTRDELNNLRCQIGTSSWGGVRYLPMVFTEQGIAMLSTVLNSKKAIEINIQIMRVFIQLRKLVSTNTELKLLIEKIERRLDKQDIKVDKNQKDIQIPANLIQQLLDPPYPRKKRNMESYYRMPPLLCRNHDQTL